MKIFNGVNLFDPFSVIMIEHCFGFLAKTIIFILELLITRPWASLIIEKICPSVVVDPSDY